MTYNINIDDYIGPWGYSKNYVSNQLSGLKSKPVNVRISSLGGSVADALDIRQQFVDHGDVTAYLYGCVASAATIIALGAKKICASKFSMFMVHKVSNTVSAWGNYNADQIQDLIDQLKQNKLENDKYDIVLASMYAAKCKKKVDEIMDILKAGQWMTAQEAYDYGFIDEIIEDDDDKIDFAATNQKLNVLGMPALPVRKKDNSLLDTLSDKIDSLVSALKKNVAPATEQPKINVNKEMKKDYLKVNELLNIEGLPFDETKKAHLTEDQIKGINDKLDEDEKEIADLKAQIEEKDKEIKNLQDNAGDETLDVKGVANEDVDAKSANELYDSIKDLI